MGMRPFNCRCRRTRLPAVSSPVVQIFGLKKCQQTRKAERWFKERRVRIQRVELGEKGLSRGELRSVAQGVGGIAWLLNRGSDRAVARGLAQAAPTGPQLEALLLEDPLLLLTPIVRRSSCATVGYQPTVWALWL